MLGRDDAHVMLSNEVTSSRRPYFIVPMMTWASHSCGKYDVSLHQILILQKLHGRSNDERSNLRLQPEEHVRLRTRYKEAHDKVKAKTKYSSWVPNVAGMPRPSPLSQSGGTLRRVGCGFLYGDAGIGSPEETFREIWIE